MVKVLRNSNSTSVMKSVTSRRRIDTKLFWIYASTAPLKYGALITALLSLKEHFAQKTDVTLIYSLAALFAFCLGSLATYFCIEEVFYFQRRLHGVKSSLIWLTYQITLAAFELFFATVVLCFVLMLFVERHRVDLAQPKTMIFTGAMVVLEGVFCLNLGKLCFLFATKFQLRIIWKSASMIRSVMKVLAEVSMGLSLVAVFLCLLSPDGFARTDDHSEGVMRSRLAAVMFGVTTINSGALLILFTSLMRNSANSFLYLWCPITVQRTAVFVVVDKFAPALSYPPMIGWLGVFVVGFDVVLVALVVHYYTLLVAKRMRSERPTAAASPCPAILVNGTCALPMDGTDGLTDSGVLPVGGTWNRAHCEEFGSRYQTTVHVTNHI